MLNEDNFFFAFALEDINTFEDYIDESIYVPKVFNYYIKLFI